MEETLRRSSAKDSYTEKHRERLTYITHPRAQAPELSDCYCLTARRARDGPLTTTARACNYCILLPRPNPLLYPVSSGPVCCWTSATHTQSPPHCTEPQRAKPQFHGRCAQTSTLDATVTESTPVSQAPGAAVGLGTLYPML